MAESSPRGLANWIHDRLWHWVVTHFEGIEDAVIVEKGATREVTVNGKFRIRLKRHSESGRVSTYPTQAALEFMEQPAEQLTLDGLEMMHLIVGYRWESDTHEIGPAVLSLRDGLDNPLWEVELSEPTTDTTVVDRVAPAVEPGLPRIQLPGAASKEETRTGMGEQ